jgi:hypothetical protein
MATVYQEAARHQDWCPIQSQDCWTELPDANWNPLQRGLLDSLPGERIQPRAFALAGIDLPRRLKPRPTLQVGADAVTNPLAFLMTPPSSPSTARIDLFHAGGREAEVEEVFRRILATGAPLECSGPGGVIRSSAATSVGRSSLTTCQTMSSSTPR